MSSRSGANGFIGSARSFIQTRGFWGAVIALTLALLTVSFPMLKPQAAGTNYYVNSVTGSDSNSGTSPSAPWRSLAKVSGRSFPAGTVINLARGSSWSGGLTISSNGANGNPVIYQAYGSGALPIIRNSGQWSRAVTINGNWNVLQQVQLRDAQEFGVRIGENATYNVVRNCDITAVGIGAGVYGQYNSISGNTIHDLKMVVNTSGGDDDYGAYAVGLYNSNNEVCYNQIYRCIASSYDYGVDGGTIEFYGTVNNSYIHHNWAHDNAGFIEVGGGSAANTRVVYNLVVNNGTFAWLHLSGNFASDVTNFRVENNTVVETKVSQNTYEVFGFSATPASSTLSLRNNIFYVNQYQYLSSKSGYAHDHNVFYFMQGYTKLGTSLGAGDKIANPRFASLANGDYRLVAGSPAIDGGTNLGYTLDFNNQPVPKRSGPDVGCSEFQY